MKLRTSLRSRKGWAVAFFIVISIELGGVFTPFYDPLSPIVIDQIWNHPETFGAALFLGLAWLIYHWFLVPVYRRRREKGGK